MPEIQIYDMRNCFILFIALQEHATYLNLHTSLLFFLLRKDDRDNLERECGSQTQTVVVDFFRIEY